jgi:hypothetical protein
MATASGVPAGQTGQATLLAMRGVDGRGTFLLGLPVGSSAAQGFWLGSRATPTGTIIWAKLWTSANTTVDANGFLKEA